ncbi:penicillin acylase family protein [Streptacidiphilus sp. PB12-B1b]|uniref:penicillin acylase family protein n=1 Tax=Streptacidiphilus sp. PB12-B1b TaxID=2705012 RepID=UPI0015F7E2BB|nr:penicillin acylase family protein [Streptacidiphilus sp. PB12-B1b]QMU79460.1 penicillin acylase family protein [Streptacidiphilus sp. PB12-B1b]
MPRTKKFRRFRLLVILLVILVVAGAVGGGWYGVRTVRASFPQTTGTLQLAGLQGQVSVVRDNQGIPQIYANSAADLFTAQGYVQAQDRFWQMDVDRHITEGTLASMFGAGKDNANVQSDAFIQTMDWTGVAQNEYATQLDQATKSYLQDFSAGVNAWLKQHPGGAGASVEYAMLGASHSGYTPAPWTPVDSLTWLKGMAWDLSGNMQQEIDRSLLSQNLTPAQIAQLYPAYPAANGTIVATGTVSDSGDLSKAVYHPADGTGANSGANSGAGTGSSTTATDDAATTTTTTTKGATKTGTKTSTTGSNSSANAGAVQGLSGAATQLAANLDSVPSMLGEPGQGIGSNSWVVSGRYTTSGKPLLADDPHLTPGLPSVWEQIGLHCDTVNSACPFDVTGFSFPAVPGVVIGHNQTVSWGFTNLGADVQDLYLEQVTGPDTYAYDNQNRTFVTRNVTIKVAGGPDQSITVRSTTDGMPIISDHDAEEQAVGQSAPVDGTAPPRGSGYAIALKWTALTPGRTMDAVFELDRATDFTQFRAAAADFDVPGQNMVYADDSGASGNIGYTATGRIPVRANGDNGTYPEPGWNSAYQWKGYIPAAALPYVENPAAGYIVAANQEVADSSYPYLLTQDWDYGIRAQQITSLIQSKTAGGGKISPDDMSTIQMDDTSVMAKTLVPYLLKVKLSGGSYYTDAQALLKNWDYDQDSGSAAAAYYNAVWSNLLHLAFDEKFPASVRATTDCVAQPQNSNVPADGLNGPTKLVSTCGTRAPDQAQPDGGDQWMTAVSNLLTQPDSSWWSYTYNNGQQVNGRDNLLAEAMKDARMQLTSLMGKSMTTWSWGRIHTLTLNESTLGTDNTSLLSGLEHTLLDRGPYQLNGGSSAVDATGWNASAGFQVDWAPSMRMVVDLSNLNDSEWINIGGASGQPYDPHYNDQTAMWANGQLLTWPYTKSAVQAEAVDTLTLTPAPSGQ